MDVFEKALKLKVRFEHKGVLSTEDLWDLSLTDLDVIYRKLKSASRNFSEDSLLNTKKPEDTLLDLKIEIVKHVFETKQAENEERRVKAQRKAQKEKLMEVLEQRQNAELLNKTPEEIQKMIDEL